MPDFTGDEQEDWKQLSVAVNSICVISRNIYIRGGGYLTSTDRKFCDPLTEKLEQAIRNGKLYVKTYGTHLRADGIYIFSVSTTADENNLKTTADFLKEIDNNVDSGKPVRRAK